MARRRIARRYAAATTVAVVAMMLGGCGGGINLDPTEWFSGSSSGSSPSAGTEGGFTVSRGGAEAQARRAVTAADLVGSNGQCQGAPSEPPRGVVLTMTECELVAVAGPPEQVSLAANESGDRRAVLTYAKGNYPGVYTFVSGRLKIIERLPTPPKPERRRAPKKQRA